MRCLRLCAVRRGLCLEFGSQYMAQCIGSLGRITHLSRLREPMLHRSLIGPEARCKLSPRRGHSFLGCRTSNMNFKETKIPPTTIRQSAHHQSSLNPVRVRPAGVPPGIPPPVFQQSPPSSHTAQYEKSHRPRKPEASWCVQ